MIPRINVLVLQKCSEPQGKGPLADGEVSVIFILLQRNTYPRTSYKERETAAQREKRRKQHLASAARYRESHRVEIAYNEWRRRSR